MRDFFTKNPVLKVLSLGISVFMWLMVHGEQPVELSLLVKISAKNLPSDLVISGELEPEIRLRLVGARTRLKWLKEKGLEPYEINLSEAKPGMNSFTIDEENFKIPRGTRVTRISPSMIRINLDHVEERMVKVEPKFVGTLEEGFDLIDYDVSPPFIKVKGARSDLEGISSLRTDPINLSERTESFAGEYGVRGYRAQWELNEKKVSVRVNLREKEVSRILESVPILIAGTSSNFKVEPNTVALRVKGPAGKVSNVMGEKMDISIDAGKLALAGKASVKIRPALPKRPGVEITMIPDNVRLIRVNNN